MVVGIGEVDVIDIPVLVEKGIVLCQIIVKCFIVIFIDGAHRDFGRHGVYDGGVGVDPGGDFLRVLVRGNAVVFLQLRGHAVVGPLITDQQKPRGRQRHQQDKDRHFHMKAFHGNLHSAAVSLAALSP